MRIRMFDSIPQQTNAKAKFAKMGRGGLGGLRATNWVMPIKLCTPVRFQSYTSARITAELSPPQNSTVSISSCFQVGSSVFLITSDRNTSVSPRRSTRYGSDLPNLSFETEVWV